MGRVLIFAISAVSGFFLSEVAAQQTPSFQNIIGATVSVRTLDKISAQTQLHTLDIGQEFEFGDLRIVVRHCEKRPPEELPETYAFIQISSQTQSIADHATVENIDPSPFLFSGWMFGSNPALSALEHPIYDVWLIDCFPPSGGFGHVDG